MKRSYLFLALFCFACAQSENRKVSTLQSCQYEAQSLPVELEPRIPEDIEIFPELADTNYICIIAKPGLGRFDIGHTLMFAKLTRNTDSYRYLVFEHHRKTLPTQGHLDRLVQTSHTHNTGSPFALCLRDLTLETEEQFIEAYETYRAHKEPFNNFTYNCTDFAIQKFEKFSGLHLSAKNIFRVSNPSMLREEMIKLSQFSDYREQFYMIEDVREYTQYYLNTYYPEFDGRL